MMRSNIHHFYSVISSGERLCELAKDLNITELEEKIPEYRQKIQEHFVFLYENELTYRDVENVKKIMSMHEELTNLLDKKKEEVFKNIKQLHAGKEMQTTYPRTVFL